MNQRRTTVFIVAAFALLLAVIAAWSAFTYTIEAGERGVIFRKFQGGLDRETVYGQGFHVKWPWDDVFVYNVRVQESESTMEVLSRNGLTISIELSYRYNPVDKMIGHLHDEVGQEYHASIIMPEIRSATREVIGKYLPDELYSTKREDIQDEIYDRTKLSLSDKYIYLDAILIRDIKLPTRLMESIERKLQQEQESLEYEFRLEKAQKEAERQRIEAEGRAAANKIVNSSLTENVLRDKGIEATLRLSQSSNSKVVIIGGGEDGLPIILGSDK